MRTLALLLVFVCPLVAAAEPYRPGMPVVRTICGTDEMVAMIDQTDAVKKMGLPIGIYSYSTGGSTSLCSGTLVDTDLFLTARHCLDRAADDGDMCSHISVKFGFLKDSDRSETFPCKEIVETGSGGSEKDYLLVRLDGRPGVGWGWYPLSDRPLARGTRLLMIHHPSAKPMKLSWTAKCQVVELASGFLQHRCDTESGSSGGGILVPDYDKPENTRVVGVHTLGGCTSSPTSSNSGPAIADLVQSSPVLKALVKP